MRIRFRKEFSLPAALLLLGALPVTVAAIRLVQIPTGNLPDDVAYFAMTPMAHFVHAAAGVAFGVLGPLQFTPIIRNHWPKFHQVSGRIFVFSGVLLAFSGLRLIAAFPDSATALLDGMRIAAAFGMIVALSLAIKAIWARDIATHRIWMIRAYALGIGGTTVAFALIPVVLIRGTQPEGLAGDAIFVASWLFSLAVAEGAIRHGRFGFRQRLPN